MSLVIDRELGSLIGFINSLTDAEILVQELAVFEEI
jgi:hypothetical protein